MRRINTEADLLKNIEIQRMNTISNNSNIKNVLLNQNRLKKTYGPCKIEEFKEGIAPEDIVSNVTILPGLKCQICFNLAWEPVEIENCSHIFCKYCLNKYLAEHNNCPVCRQTFIKVKSSVTLSRCCGEFKIKCRNFGCKETPSYSNYMEHLEKCKFKKYMCLNDGCKFKGIREDVKTHCLNCEFRIIDCKYCHNPVKFCDFEKHSKTVCTQEFTCQLCHLKMERGKFFSKHYSKNGDNIECLKAQVKYYMDENSKLEQNMKKITALYQKEKYEMSNSYDENTHKLNEKITRFRTERNTLLEENKNLKAEIKFMDDTFDNLHSQIKNRKNLINNVNNVNNVNIANNKEDKKNKNSINIINSNSKINIELNKKAKNDAYNTERSERENNNKLKSLKDFNLNTRNNNFYFKASYTQNDFYKTIQ